MLVQLLSGQVLELSDDKCAKEQLSELLSVPVSRIKVFSYDNTLYALIQDHSVEWREHDILVRDTLGFPYKKYELVVNETIQPVYQGSGGYGVGKRAGLIPYQIEIIYPIREWYTREELEQKMIPSL